MKTITLLFVFVFCDVTQAQTVDEQCSTYQSQNQREGYEHASADRQGYLRYAGCFDQGRTGMLHGRYFHSFNMTHEMCFSFCERWVYRFAGLRGGTWCTCDNSYNRRQHRRQPSFQCSTLCPGGEETSYQWCGGFRRVSLFTLRQRFR